jgi:hypothetical protein
MVPVPNVASWEELDALLLRSSKEDEQRIIGERMQTVGAGMSLEQEHLKRLKEGFDLAAVHFPHVNTSGCAKVLTNFYSVPLPVGLEVQAKVHSAYVEIWHQGECLARHERCFNRQQKILNLEHYLDALTKKPGAFAGSTALEQWRAQGRWPASFDRFWEALKQRRGKQDGTRAMIDVLLLGTVAYLNQAWCASNRTKIGSCLLLRRLWQGNCALSGSPLDLIIHPAVGQREKLG